MIEHKFLKEETLHLMKEVSDNPQANQRLLSQRLNVSLGKINYLLKELGKKGIIEIVNFSTNPDKAKKLKYILTPKGMQNKVMLTQHFLKIKENEYNRLKKEYESYVAQESQ